MGGRSFVEEDNGRQGEVDQAQWRTQEKSDNTAKDMEQLALPEQTR